MIDRLTKIQLAIFAVITAITLTVMGIFYLRLPATFGIGTYSVSADFVAGGGLYKNGNVTYRGVAVGRVESVTLNPSGVTAEMRLNSGTPIPQNVIATVKSVSAIGEQYIDRCLRAAVDGELTAVQASKAKWWCTELNKRVVDACVQLHGGYGYMNEYKVARDYVDVRIQTICGGTTEIMKEIIGRDLGL